MRTRALLCPLRQLAARSFVALAAAAQTVPAVAELPVPCSPCNVGGANVPWTAAAGLKPFQRAPQVGNGGRDMVIHQGRDRQVYSWESFDIGAGRSVEFRQPSSRAAALNRVLDTQGTGLASVIEGSLRANGQVYLINRNGVLFKRGASVDVNTLLASTLDINQNIDGLFEEVGIGNVLAERITQEQVAALIDEADGLPGNVVVEQGAIIEAGRNGRIVLVGANVENRGVLRLSDPGGQALLVAGEERVYFFEDGGARGLGVEIGGDGGTVSNIGQIIAGNGNVTLAGLTVNQDGVVRATNAVSANGTIRLQARDRAFDAPAPIPENINGLALVVENEQIATRSGTVSFGRDSVTEILPEAGSADVVVDEQDFLPGRVEVRGQDIVMERNARITAPAGDVEIIASARPELGNAGQIGTAPVETGSITLEQGATIDVSGVDQVAIPASRNIVQLQLRRGELSASPINRDGPLLGTTLSFDLRDPPGFIDVSGALGAIGRGILERSTAGGAIKLYAAESVRLAQGSLLDASGGSIDYTAASAAITRVLVGNRILNLGDVGPGTRIDAVLGAREAVHPRWGYTSILASSAMLGTVELPAYFEGKDAGSIDIASLNAVRQATEATLDQLQIDAALDGRIAAGASRGRFQVEVPGAGAGGFARPFDQAPVGGSLTLELQSGDYRLGGGALADDRGNTLELDGLRGLRFDIGSFAVAPGSRTELGGGGQLAVVTRTGGATVAGAISAPAGAIDVEIAAAEADLVVLAGADIDVAGEWINESLADAAPAPAFIDGGAVSLRGDGGGALRIDAGSSIDVGGGARLGEGGTLSAGNGGSILIADGVSSPAQALALTLDGDLSGYVFAGAARGASYTLETRSALLAPGPRVRIDADRVTLGPSFFTDAGFTDFTIRSTQTATGVADAFALDLVPHYRILNAAVRGAEPAAVAAGTAAPSGLPLDEVSTIAAVDNPLLRAPTSLALETVRPVAQISSSPTATTPIAPSLSVAPGARLAVDTGGSLRLAGSGSIAIAGTLEAPAGEVIVDLLSDRLGESPGFDRARGIWLLDGSLIDVAGVVLETARDPLTGQVERSARAAGTVALRAGVNATGAAAKTGGGFIIASPGARIDVSGATGSSDVLLASGGTVPRVEPVPIASDAGRIALDASHGVQFFASVDASARQDLGALGGTLAITLDADRYQENELLDPGVVPFPLLDAARIELEAAAAMPDIEPLGEIDAAFFGRARFDLQGYRHAGFDALELSVQPDNERINPSAAGASGVVVPRIDLVGDLAFDAGHRLVLDAPVLYSDGGTALLRADYVRLGYADESGTQRPTDIPNGTGFTPVAGSGSVIVEGGHIDFTGLLSLRGFGGSAADGSAADGIAAFLSDRDIRLNGMLLPRAGSALRSLAGRIDAAGDVLFRAERIYASTLTEFVIDNVGDGATTSFLDASRGAGFLRDNHAPLPRAVDALLAPRLAATGGQATIPNAGGGSITVTSDVINQFGRLYAPFGGITLDADSRLVLAADSLTSVSGIGVSTLFGETTLGEWTFSFVGNAFQDFTLVVEPGADDAFALDLPDKSVRLIADGLDGGDAAGFVDLRRGAVIDVRGGGELLATEFVIGPTGKVDLLQAGLANGSFALMPALGDGVGLVDPLETRKFEFDLTTQFEVLEGGVSGIAPGRYAVLPPRYAILPGALLVTPEAGDAGTLRELGAAATSSDGLPLVTGVMARFGQATVNLLDLRQYRVESTAQLLERAEYRVSTADDFFPRQALDKDRVVPLLPRDAGAVQILPNFRLNLGGSIAEGGPGDGAGSRVDISAENILIAASAGVANPDDAVVLVAGGLRDLNAGSILIGGTRRIAGAGVIVDDVSATSVTVDGAVDLTLDEFALAASERITLRPGSRLAAAGPASANPFESFTLAGDAATLDAAVLGVSSAPLPGFTRDGAPAGLSRIAFEPGARLAASGSLLLDATGALSLDGALAPGRGADLHIGAPAIALGEAGALAGAVPDLAALGALGTLELVSAGPISVFGDVALTASRLRLDAAGLRGLGGTADVVTLAANQIELANTRGTPIDDFSGVGNARLALQGRDAGSALRLGPTLAGSSSPVSGDDGDFDLFGFRRIDIASDAVVSEGRGTLEARGDVSIRTGYLAAGPGGRLEIRAPGASLVTAASGARARPDAFATLGGAVSLSAARIDSGADIIARSGSIWLDASGDGAGDRLRVGGLLDASGLDRAPFGVTQASSAGGLVHLQAAGAGAAALLLDRTARIDVSGGGGADAQAGGRLELRVPQGGLQVADARGLVGASSGRAPGAELVVDAGSIAGGAGTLMAALADAGDGFRGTRSVRARSGDITFDDGQVVRAARLAFSADTGTVRVADAQLDASGWWGGEIALSGADIVLEDGARLDARASGWFAGRERAVEDGLPGGIVTLAAPDGTLSLAAGARIDVAGTRANAAGDGVLAANTGRVRLVAARTGNDLALDAPLATTIAGAGNGAVELIAHRVYTPATVAGAVADAQALSAAQGAVLARLGVGGDARFRVAPGVELRATNGTLSANGVNAALLSDLFDAENVNAGVLTVRRDGDLTIDLDVRDGLVEVATPADLTCTGSAFFCNGNPIFGIPPATLPQTTYLVADDQASWTLQLVAGADVNSPDLLAVDSGAARLRLAAGVDVITGSGDINLAASGDIELADNANLLVAGRHDDLDTYTGTIADDNGLFFQDFIFQGTITAAELLLPGVSLPDRGGDIHLRAGGSLRAEPTAQFVAQWMTRTGFPEGRPAEDVDALEVMPSSWGLFIDRVRNVSGAAVDDRDDRGFNQGIGAFGGGSIHVDIAADVEDVSFSIPTSGRQLGSNTFSQQVLPGGSRRNRFLDVAADPNDFTDVVDEIGGGQLRLRAGGDVNGIDLVLFRGEAALLGHGEVSVDRVAAGNANVRVSAASGLTLGEYIDPMLMRRDNRGVTQNSPSLVIGTTVENLQTTFFSYGPDSGVDLSTAAGTLALRNLTTTVPKTTVADETNRLANVTTELTGNVFPGDVRLAAPGGSISAERLAVMFPKRTGTLRLLAAEDIVSSNAERNPRFLQSDFDAALLPSRAAPAGTANLFFLTAFENDADGTFGEIGHARTPVHLGDREPNRIVSRDGDLVDLSFRLAKRSVIGAGRDIDSIDLVIQHPNGGDLSRVEAGRDIRFAVERRLTSGVIFLDQDTSVATDGPKIAVGGPGLLQVLAGRNIDLGVRSGIRSFGDEENPVLPDAGADLLILAGLGTRPDLASFTTRFLDADSAHVPAGAPDATTIGEATLARIRELYGNPDVDLADLDIDTPTRAAITAGLARYLAMLEDNGEVALDPSLAPVEQFRSQLDDTQQLAFLLDVFFDELKASSLEAADPSSGRLNNFIRGRHAIATLFPAADYEGNVVSALSAVQTLDGGDIQVVAPGGTVDAGTTAPTQVRVVDPDTGAVSFVAGGKEPLNLGYVAFRDGAISMFTGDSINVNSTRIFTQKGGDITLWADRGNIDAGRGQRDAVTLASTAAVYDEFLNFVDDPPISVSGSGIRTLAPPGVAGGSIFLAAPEGIIDAGDAGIESDSGLVLAAQEVANADFISAGGPTFSTVQVPTSVGASLGNLGDVSAAATASVTEATQAAAAAAAAESAAAAQESVGAPRRISVDVLGFGG